MAPDGPWARLLALPYREQRRAFAALWQTTEARSGSAPVGLLAHVPVELLRALTWTDDEAAIRFSDPWAWLPPGLVPWAPSGLDYGAMTPEALHGLRARLEAERGQGLPRLRPSSSAARGAQP